MSELMEPVTKGGRGKQHHCAKIDEKIVREIRESGLGCTTLARKYGIAKQNAWLIKRRLAWKHVR